MTKGELIKFLQLPYWAPDYVAVIRTEGRSPPKLQGRLPRPEMMTNGTCVMTVRGYAEPRPAIYVGIDWRPEAAEAAGKAHAAEVDCEG